MENPGHDVSMKIAQISKSEVRKLWLKAQGLDRKTPFGRGAAAVPKAVQHLGYVQIDTINVIERSHHHILFTRIPDYQREYLRNAQSESKTVFEYWTHALSYVATDDFKYFIRDMKSWKNSPSGYFSNVKPEEMNKVLRLLKSQGAITIRDIDDDALVDKDHPWASRKPSKRALQKGFYGGDLVISERQGMLKKYDLTKRHFGWDKYPKAATANEVYEYHIDRALRAQAVVSVDSIAHLEKAPHKKEILKRLEQRVKKGLLEKVEIAEGSKEIFWADPKQVAKKTELHEELVHILSPFDPLVIQRKRFHQFFDYDHRFEAYVPKEKRKYGYFGLPVIDGDKAVAVLDLKADRKANKVLMQQWTWLPRMKSSSVKHRIEEELHRFEKFQLGK
jgi:Uncharacterized protein conserved in bacteria